MRNPHLDRTLGHEANRSFTQGLKQGWGDRRPPAQTIWKANPHQGERAIGRNPFKWNFDSGRQGLENWKREQEGPNTMTPLAYTNDLPWIGVGEVDKHGGTEAWKRYNAGDPRYYWDPKGAVKTVQPPQFTGAYPKLAMNKGLDNYKWKQGGNLGGTFNQEGYGDPNYRNAWGGYYTPDYNYDPYDDNVLDPGLGDHSIGPLYFG